MSNPFRTIAAAISGSVRGRKVHQTTRRAHLELEVLGERTLLSVSPILAIAVHTPMANVHTIPLPHRVDVPNLRGFTFIKTETYNWFGSASFTGTWSGEGPDSKTVSGTLVFAANSKAVVNVTFSWTNGSGGQNSFSGSLTSVPNRISVFSAAYYLTGNVTSSTGGGPGMVSGYGYPPVPVLKANFRGVR
jgi:hypothetical protein